MTKGNTLGLGSLEIENQFIPGNHWVDGGPKVAVVNHIMQGTMESTLGWFRNEKSEVSSNFGISQEGKIVCYVHPDQTAWANGWLEVSDLSGLPWLAERPKVNPNKVTISIECEGNTGQKFSEAQTNAIIALNLALAAKYKIPSDRRYFVGHFQISPNSKPKCPGATFPWGELYDALGTVHTIPQVAPPKGPEFQDPMTGYWVVEPFATYYASQGGIGEFGRPISGMTSADKNFEGQLVQWFERARLEQHKDGNIYRGLLGVEAYRAIYGKLPEYFPEQK